MTVDYDFTKIESHWQQAWAKAGAFTATPDATRRRIKSDINGRLKVKTSQTA